MGGVREYIELAWPLFLTLPERTAGATSLRERKRGGAHQGCNLAPGARGRRGIDINHIPGAGSLFCIHSINSRAAEQPDPAAVTAC